MACLCKFIVLWRQSLVFSFLEHTEKYTVIKGKSKYPDFHFLCHICFSGFQVHENIPNINITEDKESIFILQCIQNAFEKKKLYLQSKILSTEISLCICWQQESWNTFCITQVTAIIYFRAKRQSICSYCYSWILTIFQSTIFYYLFIAEVTKHKRYVPSFELVS